MKILGSDFDNTIYFLHDEVTTIKNITAIKKFIEAGNIFCIITGRTFTDIKKELEKLQVPYSYLVCADGALIFDSNDNCLKTIKLDQQIVEQAITILHENGYNPYLEDGYKITTDTANCIKVSSVYAKDKKDGVRIAKLIKEKLNVYTYASRAHVNINNPLNDKKQAVYRLAEVANLNTNDFYVIGDDVNDYEMLETFNSAVIKKHNVLLDKLNLPEYDTLADYIEMLLNN